MPTTNDSTDESEPADVRFVSTFDPDGDRPSETIVTAVATLCGSDPTELAPLYEVVDPDALDSFVEHAQRAADVDTHRVRFTYEEFDIGVRTDGEIRIRDTTATAS
ncbi:HalOD1 output domain-containing protein [Natrinema sp. SYSU A 869]|uniref:HalOD1 output domain-containing protein n=1 Tax=Natrinema sp. SYSU A 869 TaxID=2871694 RepID=UPI001CA442DA|nr:HalOD1 output domain-containing protein [Natrinema sp. SYSU A 869]